jgi:hypothetical protein
MSKLDCVYLVLMLINLSFIKYLKCDLKIFFFLHVLFYMRIYDGICIYTSFMKFV